LVASKRKDSPADDAGQIGVALFDHSCRQLFANAAIAALRVAA
jgi:hypothetical protein